MPVGRPERCPETRTSPNGYRLEQYERFRVRESLQEISGLVFHRDEAHFIANNDEQGKLFQWACAPPTLILPGNSGKAAITKKWCMREEDWLVLKSNGTLL